jgi:hypothetical protein
MVDCQPKWQYNLINAKRSQDFLTHTGEFYMSKTFTHAGVSKLDGQFKVRFCNDAFRQKVLIKNGHTDIDIVELKTPMTKEDAIAYLLSIDFATTNGKTNEAVQAALLEAVDKRAVKGASKEQKPNKEAKKAPKPKTPKALAVEATAQAVTPKVKVDLSALEDAPF